jgi:teichoic acid transport system ATP-binding protein
VSDYEDSLYTFVEKAQAPLTRAVVDEHEGLGRICEVSVLDKDIATFSKLRIKLKYELFVEDLKDFLVGIAIFDRERNYLFGPNTFLDKYQADCSRGVHKIVLTYPRVPLLSGAYSFDVGIFTDNSMVCIDYKRDIIRINIKGNYIAEGVIYLDHYWEQ